MIGSRFAIDEYLAKFKGVWAGRQFMPNKKEKYGLKFFKLNDDKTFLVRITLYPGAAAAHAMANVGVGGGGGGGGGGAVDSGAVGAASEPSLRRSARCADDIDAALGELSEADELAGLLVVKDLVRHVAKDRKFGVGKPLQMYCDNW